MYNEDESINTGYIPGWQDLERSDKEIVISKRKNLGIKPRQQKNKTWKRKGKNTIAAGANSLKQLDEANKKYKVNIKAMKRTCFANDKNTDDTNSGINAGDQFGGKVSKKKSKS